MNEDYIQLCKRTNDPKLQWLEDKFKSEGIRTKRQGESSHAPILLVHRDDEDSAWKILSPIDDIPDDDPQWGGDERRCKLQVDPTDITHFDRDTNQLESFWLFCMFVAGKNSDYASRCLSKLIHAAKLGQDIGEDGVFNYFKSIGEVGVHNALVASKVGQYGRLTKGIMQSLDLDLRTCTLDDLLNVYGVGNKTARFFLLHTRQGCDYAVLDTHILAWLRDNGVEDAPKNTPTNSKKYQELEKQFRYLSRLRYPYLSDAQIDLLIWSDQSGRISGDEVFDMEFPFESRDGVDD